MYSSSGEQQDLKLKGDALLKYYFFQFYVPDGVFLDLRDQHLILSSTKLFYKPPGLWYQFSSSFRHGIVQLYEGFYSGNDEQFENGLIAIHLLKTSWSQEEQNEIQILLKSHFGESLSQPMHFDLREFQKTFLKIFQFLARKKVKLSSEFVMFGLVLVSLYLSLEKYKNEHEVKLIFLEVMKHFKDSETKIEVKT